METVEDRNGQWRVEIFQESFDREKSTVGECMIEQGRQRALVLRGQRRTNT